MPILAYINTNSLRIVFDYFAAASECN